jgi:hypothetical protein
MELAGRRMGGMRRGLFLLFIQLALVTTALGHGGGLDKCGGHKDKKRGGYHVHNMAKYCGCYPDAAECKKSDQKTEKANPKQQKR